MPHPPNPPAQRLLELAARAMAASDFPAAETHLRAALAHDPANPTALHHLALRLWLRGETDDARRLLERAAQSAPDDPTILTSYATMLHELHQPREALNAFLRVLALDSNQPDIWNAAGICLRETGQPTQAVEFYLRALTLRPAFPEAHSNLAAILTDEGDPASAIDHLHQAIVLNPALADAHHNLGIARRARFEYAAAEASLRKALHLNPDNADTISALGELLSLMDNPEAEPLLRRAVALRPDDAEKHWNLALELLKRGDYPNGWREYESRWQRPKSDKPLRPFPQPLWRGEPLAGRTLLLHAEQGLGDTLQFLRYLPAVLAHGARIVLEVQPPLRRLTETFAANLAGSIQVIAEGDPLPAFDTFAPLMSLPAAFATTIETIPPPLRFTPTLSSRPEAAHFAAAADRPVVPAANNLRIGLAWTGNPRHQRDRERSVPTEALLPLLQTPNCTWVSLQTGPAADQLAHLTRAQNIPIEHPPLHDFIDTAAVLDTLDLVLSVDSVVAHLAASQGIPTWVLLPYVAEWRWLRPPPGPSSGNPWYPQATLFRQRNLPDGRPQLDLWQPLLAELVDHLASFTRSKESPHPHSPRI